MERSNEHGEKTLGGRESCELTVLNSLNTSCHRLQAQNPLCVAVKNLLHQIIRVAQLIPFFEKTIIWDARIVAAEHDFVLEPAFNIPLQSLGEIFRGPA